MLYIYAHTFFMIQASYSGSTTIYTAYNYLPADDKQGDSSGKLSYMNKKAQACHLRFSLYYIISK